MQRRHIKLILAATLLLASPIGQAGLDDWMGGVERFGDGVENS